MGERGSVEADPYQPVIPRSMRDHQPAFAQTIDWEAIAHADLAPEVVDALYFDWAVEGQTPEYALYALLNSKLRRKDHEAEEVAVWIVEEAFHERYIHHALQLNNPNIPDIKTLRQQELAQNDQYGGLWRPLGALGFNMPWPRAAKAIYAVEGVKNEATTAVNYRMTADLCENEALAHLLKEIAKQEALHEARYSRQAKGELEDHELVQFVVRSFLTRFPVRVVGEGFQPKDRVIQQVKFLSQHSNFEASVKQVDEKIRRLPGLEDVSPMEKYVDQALAA